MTSNLLKRKRIHEHDFELCIICQDRNSDTLEHKQSQAINTLIERALRRKKARDTKYYDAIGRIERLDISDKVLCHRKCHSDFIHPKSIKLLESKAGVPENLTELDKDVKEGASSSSPTVNYPETSRSFRKSISPMNWELCLFCQENCHDKLFNIATFSVSDRVLQNAKFDNLLRVRLGNVSDLIAAEGKYHLNCMNAFRYETQKTLTECKSSDLAMIFLVQELVYAANKHQILQLSDVWTRYSTLVEETSSEMPQSYVTRRSTFKETLQGKLKTHFQFLRPLNRAVFERETILVPHALSKHHYGKLHYEGPEDSLNDKYLTMPKYETTDSSFMDLVHVALKLRSDLEEKGGHDGLNISEDDVIGCIPDSLPMFLNVLYGGQEVFDHDLNDEYLGPSRQKKVLSVAQDIVYGVSDGKKWTPKHIGLACTLHQMTRSKQLLQLFSSAGHTLSYRDVLRVDNGLAEKSLESLDKDFGHFVPLNMKLNVFTHFTADNIDKSDSTLDGKNTFHATQIACRQRGSEADFKLHQVFPSKKEILNVPVEIDRIIPATIVEGKSQPVFSDPVNLDIFKISDEENDSYNKAFAKDVVFHLQRNDRHSSNVVRI